MTEFDIEGQDCITKVVRRVVTAESPAADALAVELRQVLDDLRMAGRLRVDTE